MIGIRREITLKKRIIPKRRGRNFVCEAHEKERIFGPKTRRKLHKKNLINIEIWLFFLVFLQNIKIAKHTHTHRQHCIQRKQKNYYFKQQFFGNQ